MSSDRLNAPSFERLTGAGSLVETRFIPQRYEPNYAYPLLVLFHARGGDEQQMVRSMPAMSWRNYVGLSLRGPGAGDHAGPPRGYGWGPAFARPDRHAPRPSPPCRRPRWSADGSWRRRPTRSTLLEDGVFAAIRQTRRALHVHSERIFLVGIGEGAAVAYRLGLSYPERFAGVVAINGWIPGGFRPLAGSRRAATCASWSSTASGTPAFPSAPPAATSPRSAPAGSASRSSPIPVPTA